jgi:hypothetical protein
VRSFRRHDSGIRIRDYDLCGEREEAHDYHYFDPDLVPIRIEESWIEEIRKTFLNS